MITDNQVIRTRALEFALAMSRPVTDGADRIVHDAEQYYEFLATEYLTQTEIELAELKATLTGERFANIGGAA